MMDHQLPQGPQTEMVITKVPEQKDQEPKPTQESVQNTQNTGGLVHHQIQKITVDSVHGYIRAGLGVKPFYNPNSQFAKICHANELVYPIIGYCGCRTVTTQKLQTTAKDDPFSIKVSCVRQCCPCSSSVYYKATDKESIGQVSFSPCSKEVKVFEKGNRDPVYRIIDTHGHFTRNCGWIYEFPFIPCCFVRDMIGCSRKPCTELSVKEKGEFKIVDVLGNEVAKTSTAKIRLWSTDAFYLEMPDDRHNVQLCIQYEAEFIKNIKDEHRKLIMGAMIVLAASSHVQYGC